MRANVYLCVCLGPFPTMKMVQRGECAETQARSGPCAPSMFFFLPLLLCLLYLRTKTPCRRAVHVQWAKPGWDMGANVLD
jgi:hypothetical protein